jgi:hypothetical protein
MFGAAIRRCGEHLMNRHPGPFALALTCILTFLASTASQLRGQAAPPANLDAVKAVSPAPTATITSYIDGQVQALTSGPPAAAQAARDALVEQVSPGRVAPGPAFLAEYARVLDTAIAPALKHQSDLVRLNAAIVVARVAERTDSAALQGATIALLNDQSHFVALWGMKAVRWVLPAVLRNAAANPNALLAAIVQAVGKHGIGAIGAPMVADAYDALTIDAFNNTPNKRPSDKALTTVIPVVQQLLQQRAKQYANGIPPEPQAEQRATLFLTTGRVWGLHTPPQRVTSMQLMSDVIGLAAQHAAAASQADREHLGEMIGNVAKAMAVIPETQSLKAQLEPATKVDARTQPQQIVAAVAAVHPAIKTVKEFAALTPPPPASVGAPVAETQPAATTPTTGVAGGAGPVAAPGGSGAAAAGGPATRPAQPKAPAQPPAPAP